MRLHVEALFAHDARARIVSSNEWRPQPAPRFFLGRTAAGNLWRVRADLPDALARELERIAADEPVAAEPPDAPVQRDALLDLLASHAPVAPVWTGPACVLDERATHASRAVAIREANANLLRGGLDDWLEDVPHRHPIVASVEGGRAVAVCASVRITPAAHEAGVETAPSFRRRGHAVRAVAAWAHAVRALGAVPLYSTSWDNAASRAVAARLGASRFGVDFHVG
jgi:RimJ/RimL family protein N-acetyltransferase